MPTYAHAMLREIHEQPDAVRRTLALYCDAESLRRDAWQPVRDSFSASVPVVIAASGSSRHSGLAAEIMLEDLAAATVDVEYASEYATRPLSASVGGSLITLSQSGETSDTLAALRLARSRGLRTLAITNHAASTLATEASVSLPLAAGPELAIPATKSFLCQLIVLSLLTLHEAQQRQTLTPAQIAARLAELHALPDLLAAQLDPWQASVTAIAGRYQDAQTFLYLGRGIHYAIAREGALKLKESAYVHAEAYPSGELRHGPNALVSDTVPLVVLATVDPDLEDSVLRYRKTLQTLTELRTQQARVIAIANRDDDAVRSRATDCIFVEPLSEYLLPAAEVVPLQIFAYQMALARGIDMDHPRHLQKAVIEQGESR